MPSYKAPLRDMRFVLHEFLNLQQHAALPGFADAAPDVVDAILDEAAKLSESVLQPLNASGDAEGCHYENGVVRTPKGFKDAYKAFAEGGWVGLSLDSNYGGQGLPSTLSLAVNEMVISANMAFGMYPGLSRGAFAALHLHGTDAQKKTYLPKLASGAWSGTMNLTEPHCGTDLGLIKTKAEPRGGGTYAISGTKIFISAGEHDLTENIVHLVLARIAGAPEGNKGISLFAVPKFRLNADGGVGARNGVRCARIEHKMGIHGNATCELNYDGAIGELVGEENKGLRAMFTMMNDARIGVALQGLGQGEVAYQNAALYAKERLQGRSLSGPKNAKGPADPILVHPDVRRLLMTARAFNEGTRALLLWTGLRADIAERSGDASVRENADDLVGLMTPVLKTYLTEQGFQTCVDAQQIYGGHGYIAENGMEQFVRDARIAMIYEGANGIQALDLVGRKLPANGGRALTAYTAELDRLLNETKDNAALAPWRDALTRAREDLTAATAWLMQNAFTNPENAGAASMDYLHILALTGLAAMWLGMAQTAQAKLASGASDKAFYEAKIATGRFFIEHVLPDTGAHLAKLRAGAASIMALPAEAFA